jgi:hypothetical protein
MNPSGLMSHDLPSSPSRFSCSYTFFSIVGLRNGTISFYFQGKHFLYIGVNAVWAKIDHYYQLLDETPIYYTALALHPGYSWEYFEEQWADRPD